jgi:hypothetical protein
VAAVHDPGGALVQDMRRSTGKAHVVRVNRSHVDKQGQRRHAGCSAGPHQNGTHQMYKSGQALRRKNFKCLVVQGVSPITEYDISTAVPACGNVIRAPIILLVVVLFSQYSWQVSQSM